MQRFAKSTALDIEAVAPPQSKPPIRPHLDFNLVSLQDNQDLQNAVLKWKLVAFTGILLALSLSILIATFLQHFDQNNERTSPLGSWLPTALEALVVTLLVSAVTGYALNLLLARSISRHVEQTVKPVGACAKNEILDIFENRELALNELEQNLGRDTELLWVNGVSLATEFKLKDRLEQLARGRKENTESDQPDFRFLVVNQFKSPCAFLSLLTLAQDRLDDWESALRSDGPDALAEVLVDDDLYSDIEQLAKTISNHPLLWHSVRFTAHLPSMWMVRHNHALYFQPLLLEPGRRDPEWPEGPDKSAGIMKGGPVFKMDADSRHGRSICAHFETLWETSDGDALNISRLASTEVLNENIKALHERRQDWLSKVHEFRSTKFRRESWRHNCENRARRVTIASDDHETTGRITDYSFGGIRVALDCSPADMGAFQVDDELKANITRIKSDTMAFWKMFPVSQQGVSSYRIAHVRPDTQELGLEFLREAEA